MSPGCTPASSAIAPRYLGGLCPRKGRVRLMAALATGAFGVLLAGEAAAFCRTNTCSLTMDCVPVGNCPGGGKPVKWRRSCVSFSVQEDAAPPLELDLVAAEDLIGRALATWTGAECPSGGRPSIDIINLGAVSCDKVEYNDCDPNANVWIFRNSEWLHEGGDADLGITTINVNTGTGELVDADVEINTRVIVRDQVDLGEVIVHEAGHFMGLEHTNVSEATMYYTPLFYNMNDLASDDIRGICAAYPPDKSAGACDPTPHRGFGKECGTGKTECLVQKTRGCAAAPGAPGASSWWLLVVAGAALAVARRRRPRA